MPTSSLILPLRRKARVEIIPLIDVVFFLLATFVLFVLALEKLAALGVQLPIAGEKKDDALTVVIQASENGLFYWKEGSFAEPEFVALSEIESKLKAYKARAAVPRVVISGDNKAKLGSMVMVLDKVNAAQIDQVALETAPPASGK